MNPAGGARYDIFATKGWSEGEELSNYMWIPQVIMIAAGYPLLRTLGSFAGQSRFNAFAFCHNDLETQYQQMLIEPDQNKYTDMMHEILKIIFDDYCLTTPIFNTNAIAAKYLYFHGDELYNVWAEPRNQPIPGWRKTSNFMRYLLKVIIKGQFSQDRSYQFLVN